LLSGVRRQPSADANTRTTAISPIHLSLMQASTQCSDLLSLRAFASAFDLELCVFRCVLGSPPALARDDVRRVELRPVVLRTGRLVVAVARLCLAQYLCHCRDVAAEAARGKPRLDLLQQLAAAGDQGAA